MVCWRRCLFLVLCILCASNVVCLDNGVAITPPMGWMTWGRFRCTVDCVKKPRECISEDLLVRTADELVSGGYSSVGYQYLVVDDCWMKRERDAHGRLVSDENRFPHGMPYVSKYIHKLGLQFGIYASYGTHTCEGYAGSLNHEEIDAKMFAEWEVDYLKLDGCFTPVEDLDRGYPEFSKQLNKTGRPIVFSCSWPYYKEQIMRIKPYYPDVQKYCNMFRTYHDIGDSWSSVKGIIDYYGRNPRFSEYSGRGQWNDPDMLMIGNRGLSAGQSRIQLSVWSILAAPLLISTDLQEIDPEMRGILLNQEVIAVDQDPLLLPGGIFKDIYGDLKVWRRFVIPVRGNYSSCAVAFVNMNQDTRQAINVDLTELELGNPFGYTLFDLFANKELKNITDRSEKIEVSVEPTDVVFYKFQVL